MVDDDDTVYVRGFNGEGSPDKFHLEEDCRGLKNSNGFSEYTYGEIKMKNMNLKLCKFCDPDFDTKNNEHYTDGQRSKLEEAMVNGDVPDELIEY